MFRYFARSTVLLPMVKLEKAVRHDWTRPITKPATRVIQSERSWPIDGGRHRRDDEEGQPDDVEADQVRQEQTGRAAH